jgi:anaerobic magnesium-protoporphyrin IX monomethyl ester cyclase
MKILLISPLLAPNRLPITPNIGLSYIAGALLEIGQNIEVLDIEGLRYSDEEVIDFLKKNDFDAIGIGTIITGYKYVKWLIKTIKNIKPNIPVILGGSISTTIPNFALNDLCADIAVIGEGENTIKELIIALIEKNDISAIKGICYKKGEEIKFTGERELIENLDDLPYPAWHLFPLKEIYLKNGSSKMFPEPSAIFLSTTRGCPYHCTYCYHPFQNQKIRMSSSDRVLEEIRILKKNYEIKSICFTDDLFVVSRKRVIEICEKMVAEKLNLKWATSSRVNLVDINLLKIMKKAGCVSLGFGIESGSKKILENIKKQANNEQVLSAARMCKKVGIYPEYSYMIGNVGETRDTIFETLDLIERTKLKPNEFFFTTPYPGTELFEYGKKNGLINDEISLFESYGEQSSKILVNFTDMTNEELFNLKNEAMEIARLNYEKQIIIFYFFKVFFKGIIFILKKIWGNLKFLKNNGFMMTYKKIFRKKF